MKSLWFTILLILILPQASLATEKTLRLGIIDDAPEIVANYVSNILTELYNRFGYEIEIIPMPAARSIHLADIGQLDGEFARTKLPKELYPNLVRVDEPILIIEHIVLKNNNKIAIENWQDLLPYRVGIIRGGILYKHKLDAIDHQKVSISNSYAGLLKMLQRDRLDIVVGAGLLIKPIVAQKEYNNLHISSPSLGVSRIYTYLHKKHATLAIDATEMLIKMKIDGSFDAITDEYKKSLPKQN